MASEESQNLTWQAFERASREMMEQLERELILAFHRGYDGADQIIGPADGDFKLRAVIQPWHEGNEPERPPWADDHRRYDFDGVTYHDLREATRSTDDW